MSSLSGDVAQMVERSLSMREVWGSMPHFSKIKVLFFSLFFPFCMAGVVFGCSCFLGTFAVFGLCIVCFADSCFFSVLQGLCLVSQKGFNFWKGSFHLLSLIAVAICSTGFTLILCLAR